MKIVKLGSISLDGTRIRANPSSTKRWAWEYTNKLEAQLKKEVEEPMCLGEGTDKESQSERSIPEGPKRREEHLLAFAYPK